MQMAVSAYLHNRRQELGIHVFPEQRVQVSATRFRVPDICVVAGPRPKDLILKEPPLICIEILSKEDRPGDIQSASTTTSPSEFVTFGSWTHGAEERRSIPSAVPKKSPRAYSGQKTQRSLFP